jgi:hypothetical protein
VESGPGEAAENTAARLEVPVRGRQLSASQERPLSFHSSEAAVGEGRKFPSIVRLVPLAA